MSKDENSSYNEQRKQLWIKAWCATANANDCKEPNTATRYADEALKAFDERFSQSKKNDLANDLAEKLKA